MNLNDLLADNGIQPERPNEVLVLRHRPREDELRDVLPWLAVNMPNLYNAFQQAQGRKVETSMTRAKYVVSFVAHGGGQALFVGVYKMGKARTLTYAQYWRIRANRLLHKKYGMTGLRYGDRHSCLWFHLHDTNILGQWKGKLIVRWPKPELSWYRWTDRNDFPINAILEESALEPTQRPDPKLVTLTLNQIDIIPSSWRAALREWHGIYFIFDVSKEKGYVGAAYGKENLLSRWTTYAKSGHGGNKQLRSSRREHLRFSILELVSPQMNGDEVIRLEGTWKERLHTREFGLNKN